MRKETSINIAFLFVLIIMVSGILQHVKQYFMHIIYPESYFISCATGMPGCGYNSIEAILLMLGSGVLFLVSYLIFQILYFNKKNVKIISFVMIFFIFLHIFSFAIDFIR